MEVSGWGIMVDVSASWPELTLSAWDDTAVADLAGWDRAALEVGT
jgi:hypothetical protein